MTSILSSLFGGREWTLSDVTKIDQGRQQKSSGCSVYLEESHFDIQRERILDKFKRFFTRNKSVMNVLYVIFKFTVISETGHNYKLLLRTQYDPGGVLGMGNTVQIYCPCPDFKFKSAWTLEQHGALFRNSRIDLELGPATTNAPKKTPQTTLCKHAYSAVMYLAGNYTNLMRNV